MASVLKSDNGKNAGVSAPLAFNMEDVQSRAKQYLQEVQQEADQLLARARQECERIQQEAKAAGLAEAEAEIDARVRTAAQQLSDQRCRTAIASCENTVQQLANDTSNWLAQWRNQTVELAANMADKLVRGRIPDSEELLRVWLEEALVAMRDARDVRVMVHPDDFAVAGRFLQQLAKSVPQAASVEVIPDPEVTLGGCIVRSKHGHIDQQLETQLQRLVEQLS